jgi:hypothetical protein
MVDFRVEAQNRSLLERVRLNHAILTNKYWYRPVNNVGHENFSPVGRGVRSSPKCGEWVGLSVCKNVVGHEGLFLGGLPATGKVVVRHHHLWCNKSSCPVCFARGWSTRRARSITGRLNKGVERGFGKIEHVSISIPVAERDLPESVLREKARAAAVDRGVIGGCFIFHGFREDKVGEALVWSAHYHCLGFLKGRGFDVCRDCVHDRGDCEGCTGFKGREVRGYKRDGYIVKVLAERKTIFGTSYYQLNHSTIQYGVKRFSPITWFGCMSYSKFGSEKEHVEDCCPVCSENMTRSVYVGTACIIKDIGSPEYKAVFLDLEFDEEDGSPNYIDGWRGRIE